VRSGTSAHGSFRERSKAKVSVAIACKSKAGGKIPCAKCIEMQRIPAHYSVGVRKHWARHGLWHLPLFRNGISQAEYCAYQRIDRAFPG
jgi:hypothetical protein